jgi:hypothetical protein
MFKHMQWAALSAAPIGGNTSGLKREYNGCNSATVCNTTGITIFTLVQPIGGA